MCILLSVRSLTVFFFLLVPCPYFWYALFRINWRRETCFSCLWPVSKLCTIASNNYDPPFSIPLFLFSARQANSSSPSPRLPHTQTLLPIYPSYPMLPVVQRRDTGATELSRMMGDNYWRPWSIIMKREKHTWSRVLFHMIGVLFDGWDNSSLWLCNHYNRRLLLLKWCNSCNLVKHIDVSSIVSYYIEWNTEW